MVNLGFKDKIDDLYIPNGMPTEIVNKMKEKNFKNHLKNGESVRILDGPFVGFSGIIEEINYEKCY